MLFLSTFQLGNHQIQLAFPKASFARQLFLTISHDREALAKFLPWANNITSVQDEVNFLKFARQQWVAEQLYLLVILVDSVPAGMIDLHNLHPEAASAEVGYWLGSQYQGQGIMTNALKQLIIAMQPELNLHKITVVADVDNLASRSVPLRLGFVHEATLKDAIYSQDDYHDADTYIKIFTN